MAYTTRYTPLHPEKYLGDPGKIICRSLWERKFAKYCDNSSHVLQWSSEETIIPYYSPVDNKTHRYFVDFWMKVNTSNGVRFYLVEIKPKYQCFPPPIPARKTKRYYTAVSTYIINQAKWEAAKTYAAKRNWTFMVLNEQHIGV